MRSIFVLLILVMIGLNGKGQSVTALPDSVLSQCCLEVTLLNGNVTTVDWVFIQYITRDGIGTKLFVEYAPNFGGIQWETQIRIQDDFDDVLERSKFIMLPFTVGSTDYAINRNWIANIEENATTGGTWVYGRFGTPTKRKFSAVESYPVLKALLLACAPRAIVVAENGLYTEGDTVRMGGFLIEPTTIQTNTYNFKLIDTLTSLQLGVAYDFVFGDTVIYMNRFWDGGDNSFFFGRNQWQFKITGPDGGEIRQFGALGPGSPTYNIISAFGTQQGSIGVFPNGANMYAQDLSNDSYSQVSTSAFISELLVGEYSTARHVGVGAYRETIGGRMWPYIRTLNIRDSTATDGQFLQLQNYLTGEAEWATIDLSAYLPIADTASMLSNYPTKAEVAANPTTISAGQVAYSNGTNLVGSANHFWDNMNVRLGIGTNVPSYAIHSLANANINSVIAAQNNSSGANALAGVYGINNSGGIAAFGHTSSGYTTISAAGNNAGLVYSSGGGGLAIVAQGGPIKFATGALTESMRFTNGGGLLINTTTDVPTSVLTVRGTTKAVSPFPLQTLAQADAITGVQGNFQYETTQNGLRWHNGTRKAYALESTFARARGVGRLIFADANLQATDDEAIAFNSSTRALTIFESPGFVEGTFVIDAKTTGNEGRITYTASAGYMQGLNIVSNKYIKLTPSSVDTYVASAETGITGNFVGAGGVGLGGKSVVVGGGTSSTRFSNYALINAQDGNFGSTIYAAPLFIRGGNPRQGAPTFANGGDVVLYGGSPINTGTHGDVVLAFNGTTGVGNVGVKIAPTQDLDVNGDFLGRDTIFNTFPQTHTTQDGLAVWKNTAQGYALGKATFGSGLSYSGGVLSATGGANIYNSDGTLTGNRVVDADGNSLDIENLTELNFYSQGGNGSIGFTDKAFQVEADSLVNFSTSSDALFEITDKVRMVGTVKADEYGIGNKEAVDLSKTQSNYIAGFATDGTVLDLEHKRDTTIYVDDSDYDFSAAITTAQIGRRYNRIIFLMTTTGAAGSDSELTLHTPDANLMQVEILIRSTDEAGGFDNRILFGTNNAVSSTGTLASSYNPSAGQGMGIRVGLKGGVYKYFYY